MRLFRPLPLEITRRALAAAMAALYAVAVLSGLFHLVEVKHEVCADHGELVHVGAVAKTNEHTSAADVAVVGSGARESHGHCGVDHHTHASARWEVPPSIAAAGFIAEPVAHMGAAHERQWVADVLASAPKQGPPAV